MSTSPDRRAARLAELVAELTGCERDGALHAVREHQREHRPDPLDLVARAMIEVDAPPPEGFRAPAFIHLDALEAELGIEAELEIDITDEWIDPVRIADESGRSRH